MKRTLILALIGAMGLIAASSALAQPGPRRQRPQPPPQEREGQRPPQPDPEIRKQRLLERYDANNNGVLDESEYAAIGKDVEAGRFGPPPGGVGPGRRGPGGPREGRGPGGPGFEGERGPRGPGLGGQRGPGGPPPFGPRHEELLEKYDANDNGRIDPAERANIREDVQSGELERPGFRGGRGLRRGPGGPPPRPAGE